MHRIAIVFVYGSGRSDGPVEVKRLAGARHMWRVAHARPRHAPDDIDRARRLFVLVNRRPPTRVRRQGRDNHVR